MCSAALLLAGCGGSESETETQVAGPTIERATAERLADLSDQVGRSLDAGDSCAAVEAAARLREDLTAAINDGKVPSVYLEDLSGLTNEIEAQIPECVEPPPPSSEDDTDEEEDEGDEGGRGKKDGKGKKDKSDEDGEKPAETTATPTESNPTETDPVGTTTETTTTETTTTTGTTTGAEE